MPELWMSIHSEDNHDQASALLLRPGASLPVPILRHEGLVLLEHIQTRQIASHRLQGPRHQALLPDQATKHRLRSRMFLRANRKLRSYRYVPVRSQEPAEGVLREQESLLPAVQSWLYPKEKHDAASAPRVRHGAEISVPLLRQAIQVHPEHLRPHQEVSPRPGSVLQTTLLSIDCRSFSSLFRELERPRSICERNLIKSSELESSECLHF